MTKKIVINNQNNKGVVNVNVGRDAAKKKRRLKLTEKLDEKSPLPPAPAGQVLPRQDGIDLDNLVHVSENCIASHLVSASWSQEPMARFYRRTRDAGMDADGKWRAASYYDQIRFNDWTFRLLGLKVGMRLAVFLDRFPDPRFLLFQNVVSAFEAPAHLHRLGMFTVRRQIPTGGRYAHVCKPETFTELGAIGHDSRRPRPLPLFEHFPDWSDHLLRLWRYADTPDLIVGRLCDLKRVPTELKYKLLRVGAGLLESDHRPGASDRQVTARGRLADLLRAN